MFAVNISRDGKHVDTVTGDTADDASNAAFRALHRLQGQSVDYALKHGGWSVSEPFKARLWGVMGSAHFGSMADAARYYRDYGDDAAAVARKVQAGEIHIGKPPLNPGETCQLDRNEGRYFVARWTAEA